MIFKMTTVTIFEDRRVFKAHALAAVIIIEAMAGASRTEFFFAAGGAFLAHLVQPFPEKFKPVFPDILKTIRQDIALYHLRPSFNIQTAGDVAVA